MHDDTVRPDTANTPVSRRRLLAGAAAAIGGGAIAEVAQAFPRGAQAHFKAASLLLERYGVSVSGTSADALVAHDILTLQVEPEPNTQYDHLVGVRNRFGEIEPCYRSSSFEGVEELSLFDPNEGSIDPCYRTTRQGDVIVSEHFHPGAEVPGPAPGEIIPCVRTSIVGDTLATFEGFDLTEGDIIPCIRVETEMLAGGALGAVAVKVDPELESFTVEVGERLYGLKDGVLVLLDGAAPR